ncbi:MAG: DUF3365 domain-containing protein [Puniceicoccaceae bacterium]
MRTFRLLLFVILPLAVMAGAGTDSQLEKARAKAMPVIKNLVETLEGRLVKAMQEEGPVAAISVCQDQALELTAAVRKEKEIDYLKRVGVRIRNNENQPDPSEQRALDYFLKQQSSTGSLPQDWVDTVELDNGTTQIRYYRAIVTQARCLLCHGPEEMMPDMIRNAIDERYPNDAARGFKEGDLRGLLVVGLDPETLE